jgi:dsDNA-specific endonuclease/ATPase MutS2
MVSSRNNEDKPFRAANSHQIQSTFMDDLQQISFDLKQVTGRSLLLIDEFGKGTNESGLYLHFLQHSART